MKSEAKLEKISSEPGIPGKAADSGWVDEGWSDGIHRFLMQYSPEHCCVYAPKDITSQAVADVAVANGIDYEMVPIIGGEVVTVARDDGERLMHAVYDAIIVEN